MNSVSLYERVGGRDTFSRLVDGFYRGVAGDPLLRAMYPDDLEAARERLLMFLEQYWGGPTAYSDQRGHPRLRLRHQAFHINPEARDHWLDHMRRSVEALELAPLDRDELLDYLDRAAHAMVNTFEATPTRSPE